MASIDRYPVVEHDRHAEWVKSMGGQLRYLLKPVVLPITKLRLNSEAIACKPGYRFVIKDLNECNHCTVERIRNLFGHCLIVPDPNDGVLATVKGIPYVWFPRYPDCCTCKN